MTADVLTALLWEVMKSGEQVPTTYVLLLSWERVHGGAAR